MVVAPPSVEPRQEQGVRGYRGWGLDDNINWPVLLLIATFIVGVLLAPFDMLIVLQRIWEQRRRERVARGEDVRPKKLPWDEED